MSPSRRHFWMAGLALAVTPEDLAHAFQHAHGAATTGAAPRVLSKVMAAEIEPLACLIIPSGDGPGARETGVIHFIDRALATFDSDKKDLYREGLEQAQQARRHLFPSSTSIASLSPAQQMEVLRAIETTPFYDALRTHTVLGFLGSPQYGGNRGGAGWAYIGFEDRLRFEPPFGYYDADTGSSSK